MPPSVSTIGPEREPADLAVNCALAMVQPAGVEQGLDGRGVEILISAVAGSKPVPFTVRVKACPASAGFGFGTTVVNVGGVGLTTKPMAFEAAPLPLRTAAV